MVFGLRPLSLQVLLGGGVCICLQRLQVLHRHFVFGAQEQEDDILDAPACGVFGDEGVAARLLAVAIVGDVIGRVFVYGVGLVVNDYEFAIFIEKQVYEALKDALADGCCDVGPSRQ